MKTKYVFSDVEQPSEVVEQKMLQLDWHRDEMSEQLGARPISVDRPIKIS